MTDDFDFYDLLEIDDDASQPEVKSAFRSKVQEYHPDLNDHPDAPAQFTAVKEAYEILKDPAERQAYDRLGHKDYVAKRTSGIPDPSAWRSDDDEDSDSSATANSGSAGPSRSSASASSNRRSSSRSGSSTSGRSPGSRSSRSRGSSGSSESTRSGGSSRRSGESSSRSRSGSSASGSGGSSSNRRATPSSTSTSRSRTGSGSSTGGSAAGAGGGGGGGSASAPTSGSTVGGATGSSWADNALFDWWRGLSLGWPLMLTSTLLFVVGVGHWASANLGAFRGFAGALAAAGTDAGALRAALLARHDVPTLLAFVRGTALVAPPAAVTRLQWYGALGGLVAVTVLSFAVYRAVRAERPGKWVTINETVGVGLATAVAGTLYGGPLLAGAVVMPFVFAVIIRHTRAAYKFKPTYGYVLGVTAPLAVIGAEYAASSPPIAVDATAVALPVLSVLLLLFSAFVRPKLFG